MVSVKRSSNTPIEGTDKGNRNRLLDFHKRLRTPTFPDPACGCGNFLVITCRELRKPELEILRASLPLERRAVEHAVDAQKQKIEAAAPFSPEAPLTGR